MINKETATDEVCIQKNVLILQWLCCRTPMVCIYTRSKVGFSNISLDTTACFFQFYQFIGTN